MVLLDTKFQVAFRRVLMKPSHLDRPFKVTGNSGNHRRFTGLIVSFGQSKQGVAVAGPAVGHGVGVIDNGLTWLNIR